MPEKIGEITQRETNSWKWPMFMVGYLFLLTDSGWRYHLLDTQKSRLRALGAILPDGRLMGAVLA